MPGLNQLKEFSNDIKEVGDEVKIRAQRGEKPVEVPLPEGISEEDDSDAFLLGMPEIKTEEEAAEEPQGPVVDTSATVDVPDLDSILAPQESDSTPDLSEFLNDIPSDSPSQDAASETPAEEQTPLEDLDLDSLLSSAPEMEEPPADSPSVEEPAQLDETPSLNNEIDLSDLGDIASFDEDAAAEALPGLEDVPSDDPNSDFDFAGSEIDLNADLPEALLEEDGVGVSPVQNEESPVEEAPAADATDALLSDFAGDLDSVSAADDFGSADSSSGDSDFDFGADLDALVEETSPSDSLSPEAEISPVEIPAEEIPVEEMPSESSGDNGGFEMDSLPDMGNDDMSMFSTDGLDSFDAGNGEIPDASMEVPGDDSFTTESAEDVPSETFDISEMDGVDFTPENASSQADEFPVTGEGPQVDDFELDSDFSIPGFSDTETADLSKKSSLLDTVDFSKGKTARPKNTLTEEEYEQFKKNLAAYPLNLRLAVEDFIAKDEFTDDAVFEIIEKILKKTSARQVATQLEKLMDISINIPRDYERRSFAQYEAYKQSFQYQLKNRIIPAAIAGVILCFVCLGLFKASVRFIYKPVMASLNYKQGYVLLENNEFPQSEDKFKEAVHYKPVKKWFFKYAEGYRNKKQFERAASMYKNTLLYFNHDLRAGVEYAQMELYDRANYERAEEIVRREILDHHINNPEGILLLGDIFLEWAEIDDKKYELAKNQYVELIQRFGETNLYQSRMLRYFIRTDKLREVLVYKNIFYPNRKSLSADDWTELSGYMLDKLYGELSRNDEYLRASIEDVRAMLEIAVSSNPLNPVAHYNLAKYFVNTGYSEQAKAELEHSLDLFDDANVRTKKNVYREINASRVLGELYAGNREYLKAQTVYTRGVNLYNEEHEGTGLEGDENTGKLFADLGDIDYFISGELDSALYNYEKAIEIKNDTPSVNYRVGAIYYGKQNYDGALASFIKVSENLPKEPNVLLALGNTLSLRGDNFASQSYYLDLIHGLDMEKAKRKILLPQEDEDEGVIVDMYLKANNNLGVALYKVARQTGNSRMNADAMVCLSESMRAWDALTRNPRTMVRMEGSNLAAQNSKYITHPYAEFEPAIYTDIPKILSDEKIME